MYIFHSSMRQEKTKQREFWRFQCLTTGLVYTLGLIVVALLVNFYDGFNYFHLTILDNNEFNAKICMTIATGLVSLLLSLKPNVIETLGIL